ncbi:leucine-rich repeat domain-containing protein [Paenibacillus puerhi]|uniref:leucine-rich repeat domain-containing protein n=1 Tax=Paenibacillus puerhi TaxID=2692622 RepID=UPI00135A6171|nr:leucine-rich repeat domain-containing protein [Paenibacillus puerhi]
MFLIAMLLALPGMVSAAEVVIKDANLEAAIRAELKLYGRPLDQADMLKLTSLFPKDSSQKIESLEGLQHAVNVTELFLPNLGISHIGPLAGLTQVGFLGINGNEIADVEPLRQLTSLSRLVISENQIESIEPLSNLHSLTDLLIGNNRIKDVAPLKELPLRWLVINNNQLEDITPLRDIPTLENLFLEHNQISNIDVLLELPKLKTVMLEGNPLNEQAASVMERLKNKGVTIKASEAATGKKNDSIRVLLDA